MVLMQVLVATPLELPFIHPSLASIITTISILFITESI